MKILYITPIVPYPVSDERSQRIYNLIKKISQEHDLFLFCLCSDKERMKYYDHFREMCSEVVFQEISLNPWKPFYKRALKSMPGEIEHWHAKEISIRINEIVSHLDFDLIHCEDICTTHYLLDTYADVPVVTDRSFVDLEEILEKDVFVGSFFEMMIYIIYVSKLRRYEKNLLKTFTYQIVSSRVDYDFLKCAFSVGNEIKLLPQGYDENFYHGIIEKKETLMPTILFVGNTKDDSDWQALVWFLREVYPEILRKLRTVKFVVGLENPRREIVNFAKRLPGLELIDRCVDDRLLYFDCDVCIAPLLTSGEGKLNVLHAMAMRRSVVATSIAVEDYDFSSGENCVIADGAQDFANAVIGLISNPAKADCLAEKAYTFVKKYSWSSLFNELQSFYEQCIADYKSKHAAK